MNLWPIFENDGIYNKNNSNFWSLLKIRWFSKTGSIFPSGNMAPLFFWPHRFQNPRPETELMPPAVEVQSPNCWITKEFPAWHLYLFIYFCLAPLNRFFCLPQPPPLTILPPPSAQCYLLERLGYCEPKTQGWGCNLLWVNISSIQILHSTFHLQLGDIYCLPQ